MARPTIAQIRGQTDFQKTYYWELAITKAPAGFFPLGNTDQMNMRCTSTEVPRYEGETAMQMMKGFQIPDPGIYKPKARMTLTFVEMIDSAVRQGWDTWIAACRDKTDLFNGLYGDFVLNTTNNQGVLNYEYNLLWCFPESTDPQELESENSNPMQFKVTLVYTDVTIAGVPSQPAG